jgi:hypothetical protein
VLSRQAPLGRRAARPAARALKRFAAALCVAAGLAAFGCGEDESGDAASPSPSAGTELTITLDADGPGGAPPRAEELSCAGPCPALGGLEPADLEPVPGDVACTEIFGGPDTVTIEGEIGGEPVDAKLTRANGCEIERFDQATPLLRSLFPGYEPGESLMPSA